MRWRPSSSPAELLHRNRHCGLDLARPGNPSTTWTHLFDEMNAQGEPAHDESMPKWHVLETEAWPPEGVAPEVAAEAPGLEWRGVPADEQAGPLAHDLLAHAIERAPRLGGVAPPGRLLLLAGRLVGLPRNRFLDRLVDRFLCRLLDWRVDGARCELVVRTGVGGDRLFGGWLVLRGGRDCACCMAVFP